MAVEFTVDRKGRPTACRLVESSTNRRLNAAVLAAVREWSFRPGTLNGQSVPRTVIVPFHLIRRDDYPAPFVPAFVRGTRGST